MQQVTAVICTRNAETTLSACIKSVLHEGVSPGQILVVDGLSTDSTRDIAYDLGCRVLSDEGKGFTAARTIGIAAVKTEYTLILGPDDLLATGSLKALVAELSTLPLGAAIACSKRVAEPRETFWDRGMDTYYERLPVGPVPVVGNPTLYRTEILHRFSYDPTFPSNEDTDWCTRIADSGWSVHRSQQAQAWEIDKLTAATFRRRWRWYGLGDGRFVSKSLKTAPTVALRHALHPAREYWGRLMIGEIRKRNWSGALFMFACGQQRYVGMAQYAASRILKGTTKLTGR